MRRAWNCGYIETCDSISTPVVIRRWPTRHSAALKTGRCRIPYALHVASLCLSSFQAPIGEGEDLIGTYDVNDATAQVDIDAGSSLEKYCMVAGGTCKKESGRTSKCTRVGRPRCKRTCLFDELAKARGILTSLYVEKRHPGPKTRHHLFHHDT